MEDRVQAPIGPLRDDAEKNDDNLIPTCSSVIKKRHIRKLRMLYDIPEDYKIKISRPGDALYNPPEGSLTFHLQAFKWG